MGQGTGSLMGRDKGTEGSLRDDRSGPLSSEGAQPEGDKDLRYSHRSETEHVGRAPGLSHKARPGSRIGDGRTERETSLCPFKSKNVCWTCPVYKAGL